jgi:hypothetical protein
MTVYSIINDLTLEYRAKKVCEVLSHSRLKCCERTLVQMVSNVIRRMEISQPYW